MVTTSGFHKRQAQYLQYTHLIRVDVNPAPNAMNTHSDTFIGIKNKSKAIHTDKQVTQSNGFILPSRLIIRLMIMCIPATLTK
jgi:hypothetical protein